MIYSWIWLLVVLKFGINMVIFLYIFKKKNRLKKNMSSDRVKSKLLIKWLCKGNIRGGLGDC